MTTYSLVVIPLDPSSATNASATFDLGLVSTIEFAAGPVSPQAVAAAVSDHPILSRDGAAPLRALAMRYEAWFAGSKSLVAGAPGVIPVELRFRGATQFATIRRTLADYLARPRTVQNAAPRHDNSHDARVASDLADIAGMHDRVTLLRDMIHVSMTGKTALASGTQDLTDRSVSYARKRAVDSQVQYGLVQLLAGNLSSQKAGIGVGGARLINQLRRDIALAEKRMAPRDVPARSHAMLQSIAAGIAVDVDPADLNAAIHAALTNELLARSCGITTEWSAQAATPIVGDYVIAIDAAGLTSLSSVVCQVTAFRRGLSTHPLSFVDRGATVTTNGGLAAINDVKGKPRYSCTGVNAEVAAIQATTLQANNSLANMPPVTTAGRDGRDYLPPVVLADQQFGYNELEAAGLTISAAVEDLVTPKALAAASRVQDFPCLFLEDLWVGYRLDLAPVGAAQSRFKSVHRQSQRVTFVHSGKQVTGTSETFAPREPANDDTGQASTEIIRFEGLSSTQRINLRKMLDDFEEQQPHPGAPFRIEQLGSIGVTPLRFGTDYRLRLRTVLLGGLSLKADDPRVDALATSQVQTASYLRARSYRPGEVIPLSGLKADHHSPELSIFLTDQVRIQSVLVAPSPVNLDTARYNGQFLTSIEEITVDEDRAFVTDLPGYLAESGYDAKYFCDPDISQVNVEVWVRNGDPRSDDRDYAYAGGAYCELIEPRHVGPVTASFGQAGLWRNFGPFQVDFIAGSGTDLRLSVNNRGRRVKVEVPPYADIELVLTPVVSADRVARTASFAQSTTLLANLGTNGRAFGAALSVVEHRIRAVHCMPKPALAPRVVCEANSVSPTRQSVALMKRERLSDRAQLVGYVENDAPSTSDVQLSATWSEIDDDPTHERYLLRPGSVIARPRSVTFGDASGAMLAQARQPLVKGMVASRAALAAALGVIGKQCAENRIFMGGAAPSPKPEGDIAGVELALGNAKRARLAITATAKARYADKFPQDGKDDFSLASKPLAADVPASMVLPPPVISHATPLVRRVDSGDERRQVRERLYAFRLYLRRPWFASGPGERIAIACHAGPLPTGKRDTIDPAFTQWGEDPVARVRAEASKRLPRAADFRSIGDPHFDPILYPIDSPEGVPATLYVDDVVSDPDAVEDSRFSLSSFAVQFDDAQGLWFCDVDLGNDFSGWIGLALYRHQPLAHEGLQLSRTGQFVYSKVLQGERVTWLRQGDQVRVTIGPVGDTTMDFEAEVQKFRDGVSESGRGGSRRLPFRSYVVDNRRYFEGLFTTAGKGLEIIRRRLGSDLSSFPLEDS
ncbi:hypothetical protein KX816_02455 [Sphingosinicellaceae bacterium]|nr:hypothetical protein KX816_02455 [Sphingosinicellaceae bacterium]